MKKIKYFLIIFIALLFPSILTISCANYTNSIPPITNPDNPNKPPIKPEEPNKPIEPEEPDNPEKPIDPDKPVEPETPIDPNDPNPPIWKPEGNPKPPILNDNFVDVSDPDDYYQQHTNGLFYSKIVDRNVQRNIQKEFYETKLQKEISDFKYPAYDYNYLTKWGSEKKRKEMTKRLFNEEAEIDYEGTKYIYNSYSDPNFIKKSIKQNSLKKHPASEGMHRMKISDDLKAVKKEFVISSSVLGPTALGLYIPAGEIATITFDDETADIIRDNFGGFSISINDNYWANTQNARKNSQVTVRHPLVQSKIFIYKDDLENNSVRIGSPFGGSLMLYLTESITNSEESDTIKSYKNLKFSISGCIETIFYNDGETTKHEWDNQIKKVNNGEIQAPILMVNAPYFSFAIPLYDKDHIGSYLLSDLVYPKDVISKWNDFLFLSYYQLGIDIFGNSSKPKINFKFLFEKFTDGEAFGGFNTLYAPGAWAIKSFFMGVENFSTEKSWGVFHEINHNFDTLGNVLFKRKDHYDTNMISSANLSLLLDTSRFRNEFNIFNENKSINKTDWSFMSTGFGAIKRLLYKKKNSNLNTDVEVYDLYTILQNTLGTYNYFDYIRWDFSNDPNSKKSWNGLHEIKMLSEFFGINFYPSFANFSRYWNETSRYAWPSSKDVASSVEKKIIDDLEKYPALDFVENMYATGRYFYNKKNKKFDYVNDMYHPFQILPNQAKVFDFENFIISTNENFEWNNLSFTKSKLGASIKIDPKNDKRLIYTPSENQKINDIDEFDISIRANYKNMPSNYISEYKWKIKVRFTVDTPILDIYNNFENQSINIKDAFSELDKMSPIYSTFGNFVDNKSFNNSSKKASRIRFKYIVRETGPLSFKKTLGSKNPLQIKVDNEIIYTSPENVRWEDSKEFINAPSIQWNKGEVKDIDIKILHYYPSSNGIEVDITGGSKGGSKSILDNSLAYNINDLSDKLKNKTNQKDYLDIFNNKNYRFQPRKLDRSKFNGFASWNNSSIITNKSYAFEAYDINVNSKYKFHYGNIDMLKKHSPNHNEDYLTVVNNLGKNHEKSNGNPYTALFQFELTFKNGHHNKVSSISFDNPETGSLIPNTGNYNAKQWPTWMKVIGYESPDDKDGFIMYDGLYKEEYGGHTSKKSIFNFNKTYNVYKMHFEFINNEIDDESNFVDEFGMTNGISLSTLRLYESASYKLNKNILLDHPWIKNNGFSKKDNDINENLSSINNSYFVSANQNNFLEFNLDTNGFMIVGKKSNKNAIFDVYVNDVLIGENISTLSNLNKDEFGQNLFSYNSFDRKMKVKIVHKNNEPLYIDFITLLGKHSNIVNKY